MDTTPHPFLGPEVGLPSDAPFTRQHALAAGLSPRDLTRLHRDGLLRSPVRGVHLAAQAGDSLLLRAQALSLVVPSDAVVCDRHAGWMLGAEMALAPGEHLEVRPVSIFRPSGRGRLRSGIAESGERNLRPADVTTRHGVRVTTALRTAHDLGRVRLPEFGLAAMDAVAGLGTISREELVRGVGRYAGMRWVRTLRSVAPLVDGRAESPPESVLRFRCLGLGLDFLRPQVEIHENGREIARLDLGHEGLRFAVEYDGEGFHSTPEQIERDRRRRTHLEEAYGWVIVVVRCGDLFGPSGGAIDGRILSGLKLARRRHGLRIAA